MEAPELMTTDDQTMDAGDGANVDKEVVDQRSVRTRMPSLHSRPMMVRTPSHLQQSDIDTPPLIQREDGVLITELLLTEREEEQHVQEESPRQCQDSTDHMPSDYDTDLENEIEEKDGDRVTSYYRDVCEQLNIVPVSYFLRHIHDQNLTMRFHGLSADETKAIALALKESVEVERLDLAGNWIMAQGGWAICRLLEENDYITQVDLADNKLGTEGAEHVCRMLHINGGLRSLSLKGNGFDDKAAVFIAEAMENNKYLKELDLSQNKFSEIGAAVLGSAIGQNENLEVLDLSWNHFRPAGGVAIARGLRENVRLKVLNLAWNGLGTEGGNAVIEALLTNQALLELDLSGNRLTLDTAKKMANVLITNDSIKILKMGNNLITSGGAIVLITAINNTDNCEVEHLDLTDIEVEYEFLRVLEDTKLKRPNFKCTYGLVMRSGNTLEDIGKPAIDPFKKTKEPVEVLQEHIIVNDTRLVDILKRYDPNGTLSVTPEHFLAALEELAVPYSKDQLHIAVHRLAETSSGKIYFGNFVREPTPARMASTETES